MKNILGANKSQDAIIDQDDPTTGAQFVAKNQTYDEKPVWSSSSRGLLDLVAAHVINKPTTTVYTRPRSVSLPVLLLPCGSSSPTAADSSSSGGSDMDDSSLIGQFLVEILDVSADFPFVGTIVVCDDHSSKTICVRDNCHQTYIDYSSRRYKWVTSGNAAAEFKDKLELIGPSRANTADSGFDITVYMLGTKKKASQMCKLSCNTDDNYDEDDDNSLCNKLQTHTMKTNRGHLYVTYSVLPDAMQGFVEVLLQLPSHWRGVAGATIYGLITSRIEMFDIGSTLFRKDLNESVALEASPHDASCSKEGYICMKVPLMRYVLAVPVRKYLHIEGKLQVSGYDAMPITIDHRIPIDCENVHTPWIKRGESLSAVRMWLRSIF